MSSICAKAGITDTEQIIRVAVAIKQYHASVDEGEEIVMEKKINKYLSQ